MTGEQAAGIDNGIEQLTAHLESITAERAATSIRPPRRTVDAIITGWEVNLKQGTGALLNRLFQGNRDLLSVRSVDFYGGLQDFGTPVKIDHENTSRDAVFARVAEALPSFNVRRILCVPFRPDDVRNAIALRAISGAPMCTYVMDDQNIAFNGIEDGPLDELLQKSALRLAVSPEICAAYQSKFGVPFHYLPPVVPADMVPMRLCVPPSPPDAMHAAVIGNLWSGRWVELLRRTVRGSGATLSFFPADDWRNLGIPINDLRADGIHPHERLADDDLVPLLRSLWFTVLPSGTMDEHDQDRRWMAEFSLPSRLVYLMCTSHIPVIVLGSRDTSAAHFVEQFGIGVVSDYHPDAFRNAVKHILKPEVNLEMRRCAFVAAARFSAAGVGEWIWQSLARGAPYDRRFEDLLPGESRD
jgi:hypothetical protein